MGTETQEESTAYHEAGHAVMATILGFEVLEVSVRPDEDFLGFERHWMGDVELGYEGGSDLLDHVGSIVCHPYIEHLISREDLEWVEEERAAYKSIMKFFNNPWLPGSLKQRLDEFYHEGRIMISMAGEAAECILLGATPDWENGSSSDRETQKDIQRALVELHGVIGVTSDGSEAEITSPLAEDAYLDHLWHRTLHDLRSPRNWAAVSAVAGALLEEIEIDGERVRRLVREARRAAPPPSVERQ